MNKHVYTMSGMIPDDLTNEEMVSVLVTGGATLDAVEPLMKLKTLYVAMASTLTFPEFVAVLQVPAEEKQYSKSSVIQKMKDYSFHAKKAYANGTKQMTAEEYI